MLGVGLPLSSASTRNMGSIIKGGVRRPRGWRRPNSFSHRAAHANGRKNGQAQIDTRKTTTTEAVASEGHRLGPDEKPFLIAKGRT